VVIWSTAIVAEGTLQFCNRSIDIIHVRTIEQGLVEFC
jgi:hypothetical protein